jgi:ABC-type transport system involved in cytochrome c biogenesis permease component
MCRENVDFLPGKSTQNGESIGNLCIFLEAHFEAEYIDGKMRMYISYREPTGNLYLKEIVHIWMVVWNMTIIFNNISDVILPIDEIIFFRGVG